ncbi:MAG: tetratricopeptide repeat protein [Bacillota bacterium]
MSEFQEVKSLVQKAIQHKKKGEYNQALEILTEGQEQYPDNSYLRSSLADVYLRLNQLGRAEEIVADILARDPENYNALTVRGNIAYRKLNYKKAVEFFQQAYQLKESAYLASRLIRALLKKGECKKALELCQKRLEENPDDQRFKKLKAEIYEEMEENEQAEELFSSILNEKNDDFAYKEKLKIKLKDKSPGQAVKELENLLKMDKYSENIHLHTLLAEKLREQENYEKAAEIFKKALTIDPENNYIRKNLGLTLYKAEKWARALPYLKESYQQEPGDYYLRNTLQFVFRQLDKHKEGMEYFRELINETGMKNLWGAYNRLQKEVDTDEKDQESD